MGVGRISPGDRQISSCRGAPVVKLHFINSTIREKQFSTKSKYIVSGNAWQRPLSHTHEGAGLTALGKNVSSFSKVFTHFNETSKRQPQKFSLSRCP